MFKYFDIEMINNTEVVDIFKTIKLDITTNDYTYHILTENENLMSISYKKYDTIDDWWIIYLFNKMNDVNFDIVNDNTIETSLDYYINNVWNYNVILAKEKQTTNHLIRSYYKSLDYSTIDSIKMANAILKNINNDFIFELRLFIKDTLINESYFNKQIKLPTQRVVFDIKNKMEALSEVWKNKIV